MARGKVDAEVAALDVLDDVTTSVDFDVPAASLMNDRDRSNECAAPGTGPPPARTTVPFVAAVSDDEDLAHLVVQGAGQLRVTGQALVCWPGGRLRERHGLGAPGAEHLGILPWNSPRIQRWARFAGRHTASAPSRVCYADLSTMSGASDGHPSRKGNHAPKPLVV